MMSDTRLLRKLDEVTVRVRRRRAVVASLICWTILAIVLFIEIVLLRSSVSILPTAAIGLLISMMVTLLAGKAKSTDRSIAAKRVEELFPDLDAKLFTAINLKPAPDRWELGYLQSELVTEVLVHSRVHDWKAAITGVMSVRLARIFAMIVCLVLVISNRNDRMTPVHQGDLANVVEEVEAAETLIEITVEPGDAEVERGASLLVLARFAKGLPGNVTLVATDQDANVVRIPLQKSLDDPIFGGRISEVTQDLTYRIEFDDRDSADYSVTTFTYPELLKADAEIDFPDYTDLDSKTLEDVRRLSVVEGSEITFDFELNKDVKTAEFIDVDDDSHRITFSRDESESAKRLLSWTPTSPQKRTFRLEMTDHNGRQNRDIPEFVIQVLPNKPANLKVTFPGRDVRVSPLEELSLRANASDDFGLIEYGLVFETPDGNRHAKTLGEKKGRDEKTGMNHLLELEPMQVSPDQLISYYFYADDIGPDGNTRRAYSDIFFSEVRPFEEIFREVPPNRSQQKKQEEQGGTQSGKLLEVQRQIVSATWNLIRSEPRSVPSKNFLTSSKTLFESQEQAIVMAEELMKKIDDEQMQLHLTEAMELMVSTSGFFAEAINKKNIDSLHGGRSKAQAAYQALLRLNSREKKVQQKQQSQSQSKSSKQQDRSRQLKALELKNNRDRYETERQAQQQQQKKEERETLQVLNRLRELARRQEDLNEKIRELENKLREAETAQEKEKLKRELKRLQEEQEELLRNLDELKERMNREENRERMADAREQVEETRERVRRASEALKENQTSKALTEGTRAQRELNKLKEEFKNQTASQFEDTVRQLRDDVRELAENQDEVAEAMNGKTDEESQSKRKTLRPDEKSEEREEIAKALEAQKERLTHILDRTKEIVQDSEETEPLLSQKLYDTMRDLRKYDPEQALKGAAQLQRYGIEEEAKKAQSQAKQGIEKLEAGVEDAARSILGDEGEALAAASEVLDELTQAIEDELLANSAGETTQKSEQQQQKQSSASSQSKQQSEDSAKKQQAGQKNGQQAGQGQEEKQSDKNQAQSPMPGQSQQPGEQPSKGEQSSKQPSNGEQGKQGEGQQQKGQQPGQQKGKGQKGEQPSQQPGKQSGESGQQSGQSRSNLGQQIGNLFQENNSQNGGGQKGSNRPLTGDEYREWSDRMRDLEEMVTTPELRSQVATIRDRARQMRIDMKRHSKSPDWNLVRTSIYGPMLELQQVIAEELARRDPNESLVPIDRDPVPDKYTDLLQKYYEELARQRTRQAP